MSDIKFQLIEAMEGTDVVFVGPPACGKGTQIKRLARFLKLDNRKLAVFPIGDILRSERSKDSERGREIDRCLSQGVLVPLDITFGIFEDFCFRLNGEKSVLFDGYPREAKQVENFLSVRSGRKIIVLHFVLSDKECLKRMEARAKQEGREDDNLEAFQTRLNIYHQVVRPGLEIFKDRGISISMVDAFPEAVTVLQNVVRAIRNNSKVLV